jgi:hypothetical protein
MQAQITQKQNVGNAGEYYIASRLSAFNFIATITLGRAEKYDILALSPSEIVCPLIKKAHEKWKNTPGKNNKKHGLSAIRWLPFEVKGADEIYYPKEWGNEIKQYSKNLEQLL